MVNSGAIATTSVVPGTSLEAKWHFIQDGLSRFTGRPLTLDEEMHASLSATDFRNRSIARLLQAYGRIYLDPDEAIELYTRQIRRRAAAAGRGGRVFDRRLLGLFISNTATAVLVAPIALTIAADLGASPYPFATIGRWRRPPPS